MNAETVRWPGGPKSPAPLSAIRKARRRARGATVVLLFDEGSTRQIGPVFLLWQLVRTGWFHVLDRLLWLLASLLARRPSPTLIAGSGVHPHGDLVLIVPIAPDLSHTFVYREVEAVRKAAAEAGRGLRIVVLEQGRTHVVHPEAALVLLHAKYLPQDGITGRALRVLRWMFTSPRRTAAVFALHRHRDPTFRFDDGHIEPAGVRTLLGKGALVDARHPGVGFALADFLKAGGEISHLHVYGCTYAANATMVAALLLGVPFSVSTYVDFEVPHAHQMLPAKTHLARFFRVCTQYCAGRLQTVVPSIAPARIVKIVYGLDLQQSRSTAVRPGTGRIFSAARLVEKKGFHFVPAALAELRRLGVDTTWFLAGTGPELARIQQEVKRHGVADNVVFLGAVRSDQVREELLHSDVALLPCIVASDQERDGIPSFTNEAMALAVPVVTTAVSGIPEVVRHLDTGYFVDPTDPRQFAQVLKHALSDPESAAIGKRGRDEVFATQDAIRSAATLLARIEQEIGS